MPELPEIEIVKRSLFKMINRTKILNIKINNNKLRYKIPSNFSKSLTGEKILNISRRSKYIIFYFKEKILLIHFGMTGKFLIFRKRGNIVFKTSFYYNLDIIPKHNHIYFKLNNDLLLIYNDVRRFGFFKLYNKKEINKISFIKKLGLEPFSKKFTLEYFTKFTQNRKKNVKNLLMDQTFISGLGNIYVNEALYMSKIHPLRTCSRLKKKEIEKLIKNVKKVLNLSISKGGSSIKDFKNTLGKKGNFQQLFSVYGRENKKCSRISCKGKVIKIYISNRSSYYCNKCQK